MKQIFTLILAFGTASNLFGQNMLNLKSGEKMKGKVERFKNDTLFFNFKGTSMKFASKEIVSIYFSDDAIRKDDNHINPTSTEQKKEGKISGIVSYFFNDNYGYKPDIGASVLIIDVKKIPSFNYDIIKKFKNGECKQPNDAIDKSTYEELSKIKFDKIDTCLRLAVDGNGSFSTNLSLGEYYIYVISNNRESHATFTEGVLGKFDFDKVEIKSDETVRLNVKFGLN